MLGASIRSHDVHPARAATQFSPRLLLTVSSLAVGALFAMATTSQDAFAIGTTVNLGTAGSYSVLGGQSVTNTGPSVLSGNVGVYPGTGIDGFPPGITGGVAHAADAHAFDAEADLLKAYGNATGQASSATVGAQLGGLKLGPGVYTAPSSTNITGPLTLDAKGDPAAVFIFQVGSGLTTASSSTVVLLNDAQSCHVFWQVAESATLGTGSHFVGTIMALTSINAKTGASVEGRALARNGSVTLDDNVFTDTRCATTSTTSPSPSASATTRPTPSGTAGGTPTPSTRPTTTRPRPTHSAAAATVQATTSRPSTGPLAFTGGGLPVVLILVAAGASVAGVALVLVARRRRTS